METKILIFAGSTRKESFNKKLAKLAHGIMQKQGVEATLIDLRDYPMPLYDGDLEQNSGLPENAHKLRAMFKSHQGFILSCPEYNTSITGVLKNTIDWISRPQADEEDLICFKNKVVTLLSTSPGGLGGLRGLVHVRAILGNIGCIVLPDQLAVPKAFAAFDDNGQLKDAKLKEKLQTIIHTMQSRTAKLCS